MSLGSGYGSLPNGSDGLLASEADREAAQAVLKTAFLDQRLTQDEFESRVGRAVAARTQAELAQLTRDLPAAPGGPAATRRPARLIVLLASGIAAVALAVIGIFLLTSHGAARHAGTGARASAAGQGGNTPAAFSGPAGCPVGTSPAALAIATALVRNPVYVDPASSLLTRPQTRRLHAKIARDDAGRIRIAAVSPSTLRSGGGVRVLTNAIAGCQADAAGTTLVTTGKTGWLATTYADYSGAARAVQAALNTHTSLAAGLMDAVGRIAIIDPLAHNG